MKTFPRILITFLAMAGIVWLVWKYWPSSSDKAAGYKTAAASTGDIIARISATGTVEPEDLVDVGAQVAGQIIGFGKDTSGNDVDYGSVVGAGDVLAQIDNSLYSADVAAGKAAVAQAEANRVRAEAEIVQAQARLEQAERDWSRAQKLHPSGAIADNEFDAARSTHATAVAGLAVTRAALNQTIAAREHAVTQQARAERNLGYTTIKSPVKGVIIDRRVNIGQTVVSSLNAPSLFLIAKDLTRMQVWVAVNEADIGHIRVGQPVTFTVDAFPGREFSGEVGKIRLNASMTQNVVSYTVEVNTDNSDGTLLPYLTANVQFETGRRENVLRVPNAALRWKPDDQPAADSGSATDKPKTDKPAAADAKSGVVWLNDGGKPRAVEVTLGLSDGKMTEVLSGGLSDGMELITGEPVADEPVGSGPSPFAPSMRRGNSGTGSRP